MKLSTPLFATACLSWLAVAPARAQARVQAYLLDRLRTANHHEHLPVYFVMADRLGYEHWFPRVQRMRPAERRATVVAELRAQAARTQGPLLEAMRELRGTGDVRYVHSNWLGNFVHCEATPRAIFWLLAAGGVEEVRYDAKWPADELEGRSASSAADAAPPAGSTAARAAGPGNATINTKANRVWALGFRGAGVIVMNADSGISTTHGDLVHRLWSNPGEIPGNGIDDDGNGYVDDVHGWDFFHNRNSWTPAYHGMLTAGALVGDGSCSGTITGQAPEGLVMVGAIGDSPPSQGGPIDPRSEVAQWDAIQYAIANGAHVQTSSHSYKNAHVPPPNYKMHREIGDNSLAAGLIRTNSPSNNGCPGTSGSSLVRTPFTISAPGCVPPPYIDPNQTLVGRKSGVIAVGAHDVTTNALYSGSPCGPFAWDLADLLAVLPTYPTANWSPRDNDYPWRGGTRQGLIKPDITGPTNGTTLATSLPCGLVSTCCTSTATPQVAGVLMLWKGANMSLEPEDVAMILHQTATPSGTVPGKENRYGAGRVDALAGLHLALCVHRVDDEPAWLVEHRVGQTATFALDGIANRLAAIVIGTSRLPGPTWGGVLGVGGQVEVLWLGQTDANGDASTSFAIPTALVGLRIYTQGLLDGTAVLGKTLSSNVIETRFVR